MKPISPSKVFKALFVAMHESQLWQDEKSIADAIPKAPPKTIKKAFQSARYRKKFNLQSFVNKYFDFPIPKSSNFESDTSKSPEEHIEILWDVLKRDADKFIEGDSLIPLPYAYIVPGGRFNEIYYWDSYFTMLGLQASGKIDLIKSMIDNFSYLIEQIGFIPNGNRTYFGSRSQPPFYAAMVNLLAEEEGKNTYLTYLPFLEKEYRFWMTNARKLKGEITNIDRVVSFPDRQILNRYWDGENEPRAEMYQTDLETAHSTDRPAKELYRDLRAACESGWDFSSRWLRESQDLTSIHTTDIIPVDLNCLLYHLETTLVKGYEQLQENYMNSYFKKKAANRKNLILEYCWDEEKGFFMDYDFVKKERKDVFSLAGMFPLFFKIATPEQAKSCAKIIEKQFLMDGGVISTVNTTDQQWDAPNGWAPLQWITIKGLRNYGFDDLANQIKDRWVKLNTKVYKNTGKMLEKYNVVDLDLETGGGEYPVQDGFGWTNGVLLKLLKE